MPYVVRLAPEGWKLKQKLQDEDYVEEIRKILRHLIKVGLQILILLP